MNDKCSKLSERSNDMSQDYEIIFPAVLMRGLNNKVCYIVLRLVCTGYIEAQLCESPCIVNKLMEL